MAEENLKHYLVRVDGQTVRVRADNYSHAGTTLRFQINTGGEPTIVAAFKEPNWFGLSDSVDILNK